MNRKEEFNVRVLIIDDEEMVRDNIEEILVPQSPATNLDLDAAADLLFGESQALSAQDKGRKNFPDFKVDKAVNGEQGLEMIKAAVAQEEPYAVIFLDMRMPGWDGLETAKRIRQVDRLAEIIIVTAYSDHSIDRIVAEAGRNVGYHVKPYNSDEILQLATKAVNDYNKLRNLEDLIATTGKISLQKNQLQSLLRNVFDQLARYIGTQNAMMGMLREDGKLENLFVVGSFEGRLQDEDLLQFLEEAKRKHNPIYQKENLVIAFLENYPVFALLEPDQELKTEKIYLLQLFIQNATQAIRNAQLQESLMQREKLTAAGEALGMLMHDLRTPIFNIPQIANLLRADGANAEYLDLLEDSSRQAVNILEDFMDFVQARPIKFQAVGLEEVVKDATKMAHNRREFGAVQVNLDLPPSLELSGDPSKLKRILMNLMANAVDVLLEKEIPEPRIDISGTVVEGMLKLTVRDNGPGIPQRILPELFKPFVTANKKDGTGLGLSIVKQFVEAHGGTIEVENNPGAVFQLTLPLGRNN